MPREEELEAIIRLCARTVQFLSGKEVDKDKMYNDERTVWYYTQKVIAQKENNRKRANEWNKAHPEQHKKHNRDHAMRKKERMNNE